MMNLRKSGSKFLMLALTLLVAAAVGILIAPMRAEASETVTVGDYTYTISDGTAVLSKYNGTSSSVTVPTSMTYNGVTYKIRTIGASAFEGNVYIKTLVIPEGITSIGNAAFKNCTSLSSITINGDIGDCSEYSQYERYGSYYGYNDEIYSVFYNAGANADTLTVTFGSSVTRVPAYLFATGHGQSDGVFSHVTGVVLSSSVTEIGKYAFYHCYELKTLTMSSGLIKVDDYAFFDCYKLNSITWGSNLTTIGSCAFANNLALTQISFPSKLTYINDNAFNGCTALTTITLPSSLTSLGNSAFKNCTSLSSITINGNIGDCSEYSQYERYGSYYGYNDEIYSVFYNAGANADTLTVTFGSSVTRVPAYLFATGHGQSDGIYAHITSVTLNSKATEIGDYAFYHCYDLKTVTLNCNGLTIGSNSFGDVTATVYYPTPNSSWTSDLRTNYGGTLTWKSKFMSASKMAFSSVANATNEETLNRLPYAV